MPKFSGAVTICPAATWYTLPLTLIACGVSAVVPRPLLLTSLEARFTVTVPVRAPAALVFTPTASAALLLAPPAMPLMEPPLLMALPLLAPKPALKVSVKALLGARLATVSAWLAVPPTRWLASVTGAGVTPACARL